MSRAWTRLTDGRLPSRRPPEPAHPRRESSSLAESATPHLTCHVCRVDDERPDMVRGETHDAYICSLDLSTDQLGDDVLPTRTA